MEGLAESTIKSFVFVLVVAEPRLGRHQRKSVTTCDFAVPSVLNGCARHMHKVTLATEEQHWLEVTQRKSLMQTKTLPEYVLHSEAGYTMTAYALRRKREVN